MNIILLSTYDGDGSGIFARQLLNTIQGLGHTVKMLCLKSSSDNNNIVGIYDDKALSWFIYRVEAKLVRRLYNPDPEFAFNDFFSAGKRATLSEKLWPEKCDLIIVTYASGMLSPALLVEISKKYNDPAIIFYGVDMGLFTGGCHYARDCEQYKNECARCPAVSPLVRSRVRRNFAAKMALTGSIKKHLFITSSAEYDEQTSSSSIFRNSEIRKLLMYVDNNTFGQFESERVTLKKSYGVGNRVVLLRSSSEPRKGCDLFVEAIRGIADSTPELLDSMHFMVIGDQYVANQLSDLNLNIHSPGYLSDSNELAKVYAISDVFLNTSLADGGPMMIAEALMSHTPVISTRVGLATDLVKKNHNGDILLQATHEEVASAIRSLVDMPESQLVAMRENARQTAMAKLSKQNYVNKLGQIIQETSGM